jgi:phosphodiesterase/alkaline phosphatase D-like protein
VQQFCRFLSAKYFMNTKTIVIAAFVVLVLAAAGYFIWNTNNTVGTPSQTASSTVTTTTDTNTNPPVPATQAGKPGIQTGLMNVASDKGAVVTGYVAPNGAATSYWFEYGKTNSLGSRTISQPAGAEFVTLATPAYLSDLTPGTTYYYKLNAQNEFGKVEGVTYTLTTTDAPLPAGSAPTATTVAAANVSASSALLPGLVSPNNTPTTYWFEYGVTQSFGSVSAFGLAGAGAATLNVSTEVSSLTAKTKYYYRLVIQSQFGVVHGATQSFTTLAPVASVLPTVNTSSASNIATSSATLGGSINPHHVSSTYWFEYSTNAALSGTLQTITATQTLAGEATTQVSAQATGLLPNTKYYFRLSARTPLGTTQGNISSFTTKK